MPSLAALRAFDAVAFFKSYSKASRILNVTEAAMRQHVRNLEKTLGYSLVERQGRGLALTENGERLSAATSLSFENLSRCIQSMASENQRKAIRVALPPSFAENWLMPRLTSFWADHPTIEVELAPSLKIVDLQLENIDFAIRYGDGNWTDGTSTYLASGEFVVVGRPDIVERAHGQDIMSMNSVPWLFEVSRTEHRVWAEARGIDFDAPRNRHFPTNSLVISAVRAGQGVSVQARALVEGDLENGVLVEVKSEPSQSLGYYLVVGSNLRQSARVLMKWLTK